MRYAVFFHFLYSLYCHLTVKLQSSYCADTLESVTSLTSSERICGYVILLLKCVRFPPTYYNTSVFSYVMCSQIGTPQISSDIEISSKWIVSNISISVLLNSTVQCLYILLCKTSEIEDDEEDIYIPAAALLLYWNHYFPASLHVCLLWLIVTHKLTIHNYELCSVGSSWLADQFLQSTHCEKYCKDWDILDKLIAEFMAKWVLSRCVPFSQQSAKLLSDCLRFYPPVSSVKRLICYSICMCLILIRTVSRALVSDTLSRLRHPWQAHDSACRPCSLEPVFSRWFCLSSVSSPMIHIMWSI